MNQELAGENKSINEAENHSATTDQEHNPVNNPPVVNNKKEEEQPSQKQGVNGNEDPQKGSKSSKGGDCTKQEPPRKKWNVITGSIGEKKKPIDENSDKETNDQSIEELIKKLTASFTSQQTAIINHRKTLLTWFAWITAIQLASINVLIFICIFSDKILADKQILDAFSRFIKYFIGATFLELMGGLLIIVKYVFSREAFDMLKHLTRVDPSEKEQK